MMVIKGGRAMCIHQGNDLVIRSWEGCIEGRGPTPVHLSTGQQSGAPAPIGGRRWEGSYVPNSGSLPWLKVTISPSTFGHLVFFDW